MQLNLLDTPIGVDEADTVRMRLRASQIRSARALMKVRLLLLETIGRPRARGAFTRYLGTDIEV